MTLQEEAKMVSVSSQTVATIVEANPAEEDTVVEEVVAMLAEEEVDVESAMSTIQMMKLSFC